MQEFILLLANGQCMYQFSRGMVNLTFYFNDEFFNSTNHLLLKDLLDIHTFNPIFSFLHKASLLYLQLEKSIVVMQQVEEGTSLFKVFGVISQKRPIDYFKVLMVEGEAIVLIITGR